MATVLSVSGSPSATSRTTRLLRHVDARLVDRGHRVVPFEARSLPAHALLAGDFDHPEIGAVTELFARADGVVIGTPVYKAAYSGLLKALLDVLPQYALAGKAVLPLATGGSPAHVLAVDYALRPVLSSMGAGHITQGWFVLDRHITAAADGTTLVECRTDAQLVPVVEGFADALERLAAPVLTG
ncbi:MULTISPECIES: NADPH-dependent FMN reductase [Kitasatospora]|uniref:NADPH-dependent FMN reductase n=1 Tax=Kitasatospora cathayae TaxID=3004092 RepID=A0ABY7Q7D9_9ACTN|nr:NADPH-dependent FMN reductase [Kitasatospora sp. HUAS 3-15]WBP88568.1 NADPH-dependent FMN reductase [Kitasatospora sp. HUAS 3-15]